VPTLEISEHDHPMTINSIELTEEALHSYDAVVIVTDHTSYDYSWLADNASLIVDTRNATRKLGEQQNIKRL
jgi:UDP-N-acetyl-D-glucosamine dehydrogenase